MGNLPTPPPIIDKSIANDSCGGLSNEGKSKLNIAVSLCQLA